MTDSTMRPPAGTRIHPPASPVAASSALVLVEEGAIPPGCQVLLARDFSVALLPASGPARTACLQARGAQAVALVTASRLGASAALLAALPRLEIVVVFGAGLDAVDLPAAEDRRIAVRHTPGVSSACVADAAFALLLAVARRVVEADAFVRAQRWGSAPAFGPAIRVHGKRLGIVGLGGIGRAMAERALGFGMQVRYHARRRRPEVPFGYADTLAGLAVWCDFLLLATSGGNGSRGLVDRGVLRLLGPEGILVNVARGSVVVEGDLLDALAAGEIAGAGLDVFAHEPQVPAALRESPRVVLTPHIASNTRETRDAMGEQVHRHLLAHFDGR